MGAWMSLGGTESIAEADAVRVSGDDEILQTRAPIDEPQPKRFKSSQNRTILDGRKSAEDRAFALESFASGKNSGPNGNRSRRKNRKVALFLGYKGGTYSGMQINPGVESIESMLLGALFECGLVTSIDAEAMRDVQWSRAARTDKGVSAACQCVSLKVPLDLDGDADSVVLDEINAALPNNIVLHGIRRATNSFNARNDCFRRRYEYVFPLRILGDARTEDRVDDGRSGDPRVAKLNNILAEYAGTHCFANFTEGLKGSDDAAKRFMVHVKCREPFLPAGSNEHFCCIELYGQSFVLYQIRKMCGLAFAVSRGILPPETIAVALCPFVRIATPTAPPMGLFLDSLEFTSYNAQCGKSLPVPIAVDGSILVNKDRFKNEQIYPMIAAEENNTRAVLSWVQSLTSNWKADRRAIQRDYQRFVLTSDGVMEMKLEKLTRRFPVTQSICEFFGGSLAKSVDSSDENCLTRVLAVFTERHGIPPNHVVRTPGRVNLIGEHCDYNDFPVIGIATKQGTLIAGAQCPERQIDVEHVDIGQFRGNSFSPIGEPVVEQRSRIDVGDTDWVKYVSWGWKSMIGAHISIKRMATGSGARLLVYGDLPRAVGLGSSSSLVTAAALMCARLNRTRLGREEMALAAAEGERKGAGTRGGAVDHTVSMCGVKGSAVFVSFSPKLETSTLPLPQGCSFVVVNSGVKAFKGQNEVTKKLYNTRVAECRLGAALVARRLNVHLALTVSSPGQLYNMARAGGQVSHVAELQEWAATVLGREEKIRFGEAVAELKLNVVEVRNRFCHGVDYGSFEFEIGKRIRHVLSEAARVQRFRELLESREAVCSESRDASNDSIIAELGEILTASHASLRDQYECSCDEVDALVEVCQSAGSVGSRITGAGWGGCILSLVPGKHLSGFVKALTDRVGKEATIIVEPSAGASVLSL